MTRDEGGGHPFAVVVWLVLGALVLTGVVGVLAGILSQALVVDLAAMWPLLLLGFALGLLGRRLGRESRRSAALLPLSLFTVLILVLALHLGGWRMLPSAEARLTGPPPAALSDPTEIVAQISGELTVEGSETGAAYLVEPILRGGRAGVPSATETSVDGAVSIVLSAADAPAWYSFAGWRIDLSPLVTWRVVLNGEVMADLRSLSLSSGAFAGSGEVHLGSPPPGSAGIIVAGDYGVTVPSGAAVVVDGAAVVPPSWENGEGRAASPSAELGTDRWSISVQGDGVVTVKEEG